jgi:hypothetical protein
VVPGLNPGGQGGRLWHVTVTVAGDQVEPLLVRSALNRLTEERPFIDSVGFTGQGASLTYWDEGDSLLDVASLALRLWAEHRDSAGLPSWEVVGLEVIEKPVHDARGHSGSAGMGSSTSLPFRL